MAQLYGPGDRVRVAGFIHARRRADGRWELGANVPCEVELPGAGRAAVGAAELACGAVLLPRRKPAD